MIVGVFYFRRTIFGNLIGEFFNLGMGEPSTESADLITINNSNNFEGDYQTTWQEENTAYILNLNISTTNNNLFQLIWTDQKGMLKFRGSGFIVDNLLIGNYQTA